MKVAFILLFLMLTRLPLLAGMGILSSNETASVVSNFNANLAVFRSTISEANYAFLGFHSTNEISTMTNTNAIVVYSMALSRLRNYHLGDDFRSLLDPWSELIVPVVVSTNVRSSFAFRFNAGRTVVSDVKFGQRKLIRELMAMYRSIPTGNVKSGDVPFAVEIPVFDIWLIGYVDTDDKIVLLPVIDLPLGPFTINRGQPLTPAVMLRLATVAQRYNGLPN